MLKEIRRPRLDTIGTVKVSNIIQQRKEEFEKKTPSRIAKIIQEELGLPVSAHNVKTIANALDVRLSPPRRKNRDRVKVLASLMLQMCKEIGVEGQIVEELRKLS